MCDDWRENIANYKLDELLIGKQFEKPSYTNQFPINIGKFFLLLDMRTFTYLCKMWSRTMVVFLKRPYPFNFPPKNGWYSQKLPATNNRHLAMLQFSTFGRNKILVAHKKLVFYFVINYACLILFLIIYHWVKIMSQQEAQYLLSGCAECLWHTIPGMHELYSFSWLLLSDDGSYLFFWGRC